MPSPRFAGFLLTLSLLCAVRAEAIDAATPGFKEKIQPFLEQHCYDCHDSTTQKGGVRLDTLEPRFDNRDGAARWTTVFDQVVSGAMPPKKKPRPPEADRTALLKWVGGGLLAAEAEQRKREGGGVVRRINRAEYENTVRDFLGIDTELQDLLPEDASLGGFDNVGEAMNTSSILMERYLEAADKALDAATASKKQPESRNQTFQFEAKNIPKYLVQWTKEIPGAMVFYGNTFNLSGLKPVGDGLYKFRVHAAAVGSGDKPVQYSLMGTSVLKGGRTLGFFEAKPGEPGTVEFTAGLRSGAQVRFSPYPFSLRTAQVAEGGERTGVAIYSVEMEGPIFEQWPPEAHRRLYGDLPLEQMSKAKPESIEVMGRYAASQVLTPVSSNPEADVERIVRAFLPRAFRRPVPEDEAKTYLSLALAKLKAGGTFEEAVRVGIKSALCSPSFLFLRESPGRLDAYALASRLSYFLWSTMPDDELIAAAAKGTLMQPAGLKAQVERMLRSSKASEFTENFTGQWLSLRDIDATAPDVLLYPEFDDWLQTSMVNETHRFFDELLTKNLSVANFIDSPFAMLNGRLAAHYGIPGVAGLEIRRVTLPPSSHRGGVFTQGAILKVTANGTTSSPVIRGSWMMRNIVGKPVPPPPEAVPAIEPDIRGAKTIREQLGKHRSQESCAACHAKMDPIGFALESFDVIGGWREKYRILGEGVKLRAGARPTPEHTVYRQGAAVECSGTLTDGSTFKDIDELKARLLADRSQIARCVTEKLLVYATGHPLGFTDRNSVQSILASAKPEDYGLRSLIHAVVQSDSFLSK